MGSPLGQQLGARATASPPGARISSPPLSMLAWRHLVQERVATLGEIPAMVEFFFLDEPRYDEASFAKVDHERSRSVARCSKCAIERYERLADWSAASLHEVMSSSSATTSDLRFARRRRRFAAP